MAARMDVEQQQVQILLEPLDDDSAAKYFQEVRFCNDQLQIT